MKFYYKYEIQQNYYGRFEAYKIMISKWLWKTDKTIFKIVDKEFEDYETIEEAKERIVRYKYKNLVVWQSEEVEG